MSEPHRSGHGADRVENALTHLLDDIEVPAGPTVPDLRRRVQRRRNRRIVAASATLCCLVVVSLGAAMLADGPVPVRTEPADSAARPLQRSRDGEVWEWLPDDNIVGRDGSASGFALSRAQDSNSLVIVLGDGELCIDEPTCASSVDHFDGSDFDTLLALRPDEVGGADVVSPATLRSPGSPFEQMNVAWLPAITGDMSLGTRDDADVAGLDGRQHFVGKFNVDALLERLRTLSFTAELTDVTLVGAGTGGFGALGNYASVATSFPDRDVSLLVDTAPWFHPGDVLRRCWANTLTSQWGLKLPPAWPTDLEAGAAAMGNIYRYLARRHPDARLGFMADSNDVEMRELYGQLSLPCPTDADSDPDGDAASTDDGLAGLLDTAPLDRAQYSSAMSALVAELAALQPWRTPELGSGTAAQPATPDHRPLAALLLNGPVGERRDDADVVRIRSFVDAILGP